MLFVSVGTVRFDRLTDLILLPSFLSSICELGFRRLVIQAPLKILPPQNYRDLMIESFSYKEDLSENIREASVVILHGGAGLILEAMSMGKSIIAVANPDLLDNHQEDFCEKLMQHGYILTSKCELFDLIKSLRASLKREPKKVVVENSQFLKIINRELYG